MKNFTTSFFILLFFFISTLSKGQGAVDHWETIIFPQFSWDYFVGTTEPDSTWNTLAFNTSNWNKGKGGIGYADGDDRTIIPSTISLYMRMKFMVPDKDKIARIILSMDYDDAFVAYLNGTEIARSNIGTVGIKPKYNDTSLTFHEAVMYKGEDPESFSPSIDLISNTLSTGMNVLAIQVHNTGITSSDMSAIPFLFAGINDKSTFYAPPPSWFKVANIFISSNLPIIQINTLGNTIVDEPKITAEMTIINNGPGKLNILSDSSTDYSGQIGIEYRGQSSQEFIKKSMAIETRKSDGSNNNVSIFGWPKENDWILYAPYSDKSLLRNVLTLKLAEATNQYSSRTKFCELFINGDYKGVYVFMEKIKRDNGRVNISKLKSSDITGDDLTGGYIIKVDKSDTIAEGWYSYPSPAYPDAMILFLSYHYPKWDEIVPKQKEYIQNYILDFENTLVSNEFADPLTGYSKYIDISSFIDFLLINELSKDIDAFKYSVFMYKNKDSKGGKLKMGPYWDFNLGYGNVNYGDYHVDSTGGWIYNKAYKMFWFERLMQDTNFQNKVKCRWNKLRKGPYKTDIVLSYIDSMTNYLDEAQKRNFNEYHILGRYIWPNKYVFDTYEEEISYLKDWLSARFEWMDNNLPGYCDPSAIDEKSNPDFYLTSYPNPFTNNFNLSYNLQKTANVEISIYDITGKLLKTVVNKNQRQGNYFLNFDIKQVNINSKGIYLCVTKLNNKTISINKLVKY
ncbi:MAG: CotH kinase family protein [Bacteroidota bacterium]|nr:CotH kinase family protein [Bacteroidota bacterium]